MLLFMDHRLHLIILENEQHSEAYNAKISTIWIFRSAQFWCEHDCDMLHEMYDGTFYILASIDIAIAIVVLGH